MGVVEEDVRVGLSHEAIGGGGGSHMCVEVVAFAPQANAWVSTQGYPTCSTWQEVAQGV